MASQKYHPKIGGNFKPRLVDQLLQFLFPKTYARPITSAAIAAGSAASTTAGGWLLPRKWTAQIRKDGFLNKLSEAKKTGMPQRKRDFNRSEAYGAQE